MTVFAVSDPLDTMPPYMLQELSEKHPSANSSVCHGLLDDAPIQVRDGNCRIIQVLLHEMVIGPDVGLGAIMTI